MHVPDAVVRAYDEELSVIQPLRKLAGSRLRILAADRSWLFDDRIKSMESVLSKLEAGCASIWQMHDLYAAMMVVPTQKHVADAVEAVLEVLNGEVRFRDEIEASSFVYDDVHIIGRLRGKVSPRSVPHESVLDRRFEIQIHTGVQYAWWRATHDELYKGSSPASRSWAAARAAGQARASLELIDGVLADFEGAAAIQKSAPQVGDSLQEARSWLTNWRARDRPSDEIRFAKSATEVVSAAGVKAEQITALFDSGGMTDYLNSDSVTPVQAVLIACHIADGDAIFERFQEVEQFFLITEELLDLYPPISRFPESRRVKLEL